VELAYAFTYTQIFFVIVLGLSSWVYLLARPFAVFGYYGAKLYRKEYMYCYLFFLVLQMVFRIFQAFNEKETAYMLLWFFGVCIEIWIFRIVARFTQLLRACTASEIETLRSAEMMAQQLNARVVYW
jgi:hypothetical protein